MKKSIKSSARNSVSLISALMLLLIGIMPAIVSTSTAYAAVGQVTSRSISMSSSAPGAASDYLIDWTPSSANVATNVEYIYVEFCTDSPIPTSTTCAAPASPFTVGAPTVTYPASTGLSSCTFTASAPSTNVLELADTSGCAQSTSTADEVSLNSVTNPNTTCTTASACEFYARIMTYSASPGTFSPGDTTNLLDDGGVALSTATTISVSATVQESINFCVYLSSASCGGTTSLVLGSGTPPVIGYAAASTGDMDFSLTTNASHGATVSVLGPTLTDGTGATIPALTTNGSLPLNSASGNFGIEFSTSTCTDGTAPAAVSPYSASGYVYTATSTAATEIASTAGPVNLCTTSLQYGVVAGTTTPSGVYTANQQLIATGTY